MWLLRFHFSFSILCILMFWGTYIIFKDVLRLNGYTVDNKKPFIFKFIGIIKITTACFIPVINILLICMLFIGLILPKKDFDNLKSKEQEKKNENIQKDPE